MNATFDKCLEFELQLIHACSRGCLHYIHFLSEILSESKTIRFKNYQQFFKFQKFSKVAPSFSSENCSLTFIHTNFRAIRQWAAFLPERTFESYNLSWLTSNIQFCIENDTFLTMIVTRLHFIQLFSFFHSLAQSV